MIGGADGPVDAGDAIGEKVTIFELDVREVVVGDR
jgi:hypothetical protein